MATQINLFYNCNAIKRIPSQIHVTSEWVVILVKPQVTNVNIRQVYNNCLAINQPAKHDYLTLDRSIEIVISNKSGNVNWMTRKDNFKKDY